VAVVVEPAIREYLEEAVLTTNRVARTFALATRILPRDVRPDVYLLYLVCRQLDDLVDFQDPDAGRRLDCAVEWATTGTVRGPEAEILDYLFQRHPDLPREAVFDFCQGQRRDMRPFLMETEAELDLYSYQVAGTVGRLMATLLGVFDEKADQAARALGIAMQRTNILRDIDEDLARGRTYLPRQTMELAGVRDLGSDDRSLLLRVEIAIADHWYERGLPGTCMLRRGSRSVRAAGLMYQQILRQIERDGRGAVRPCRSVVPSHRKLLGVMQALISS
jgi:phytoene synthase